MCRIVKTKKEFSNFLTSNVSIILWVLVWASELRVKQKKSFDCRLSDPSRIFTLHSELFSIFGSGKFCVSFELIHFSVFFVSRSAYIWTLKFINFSLLNLPTESNHSLSHFNVISWGRWFFIQSELNMWRHKFTIRFDQMRRTSHLRST